MSDTSDKAATELTSQEGISPVTTENKPYSHEGSLTASFSINKTERPFFLL